MVKTIFAIILTILHIVVLLYFTDVRVTAAMHALCEDDCPYGFEVDEEGLQTCNCIYPCKNTICNTDEACQLEHLDCDTTPPCGIRTKCTKICKNHICLKNLICENGFALDCDNCPICNCYDPCENVFCPKHQYCAVGIRYCLFQPCPPMPHCKSYCPEGLNLLIENNEAVTCTASDSTETTSSCPDNYECYEVPAMKNSYCCGYLQ